MDFRSPIHIERWIPQPDTVSADLDMLGTVLHACVHSGASVNFVLPYSHEEAVAFWVERVLPGVSAGTRPVLVARLGREIVGTVQLDLDTPPNQCHRAEVRKLLVHPDARRRGIARRLMHSAEELARESGRSLLTLDTATGDSAEPLYLSLGYVLVGIIPRFALSTDSTELEAASFFYKELL